MGSGHRRKARGAVPSRQEPVTEEAAMKTISADYNAMTEAGHVRLTLPCSQEDILKLGLRPGDWAWLSDSEVMVGRNWPSMIAMGWSACRTGTRSYTWTTKVPTTSTASWPSSNPLLTKEPPSSEDEPRILELLTQLEHASPPHFRDASPGLSRLSACPRPSPDGQARPGTARDERGPTSPA